MSDNKKYYYIRLKENFFDSDEIKLLESIPNDGYKFSNILLKMYLKSLKYNGRLMFNERIPFSPEMLATVTGHSVGDVNRAIEMFKQFGLIEVLETGEIYMLDIQNFIGRTSTESDRKRQYRNEIAAKKASGTNVRQLSAKFPPEIEIEKEIDIELEKEPETDTPYRRLVAVYESNGFGTISSITSQKLNDELKDFTEKNNDVNESVEVIKKAFEIAVLNGANNLNYVLSITKRWYQANLFTLKDIEAAELKRSNQKSQRSGKSSYKREGITPKFMQGKATPVPEPTVNNEDLPEWMQDL